ncbi:hypothetical protein ASZ90_016061 [hydrocarbon metagenome]|uniref:Uncharacterized protein n=1 Tax=hydrocarbon metagenome TaxID=938273 RepID=A0A0W8F068_9ZZZZ
MGPPRHLVSIEQDDVNPMTLGEIPDKLEIGILIVNGYPEFSDTTLVHWYGNSLSCGHGRGSRV